MHSTDPLIQQRIEKLAAWQARGFTYRPGFDRTHTNEQAKKAVEEGDAQDATILMGGECGTSKALCGRIIGLRDMGKLAFVRLRDGSGDFQVCLAQNVLGKDEFDFLIKNFDLGDFAGFHGEFFVTKHGEPTLMAAKADLLSKALRPLPEKFHGLQDEEAKYRYRYLDLATNPETQERFRFRSRFIATLRDFYAEKGFLEVENPVLMHEATGAAARPYRTHHHAHDMDLCLRISHELPLKMLVGGGFEKVYELGKAFRNEGIDPSHLPEHTHLEHYEAYTGWEHQIEFTQEMFDFLFEKLGLPKVIEIPDRDGNMQSVDFTTPWQRIDFTDLVAQDAGIDLHTIKDTDTLKAIVKEKGIRLDEQEIQNASYATLVDAIYKKVSRPKLIGPVVLYNYPKELQPLARLSDTDNTMVEQIQVVVNGWEIVKAYGELVDPIDQKERFIEQAGLSEAGDEEAMVGDDEYITAMEHGFPPISGWGMGVDRLLALLTGQTNLRDVVLFPLMKPIKTALTAKEQEARYRAKRLVVIADETQPAGVVANAIGQLGIAIGGHSQENLFDANILHDADGRVHYTDSLYPMANLAGSQPQMAQFLEKCYAAGIQAFDFSDIMRTAHTDDQMKKGYQAKKTADIGYIAVGALVPSDFEKEWLAGLELFGEDTTQET